jgi:hypothetical protein
MWVAYLIHVRYVADVHKSLINEFLNINLFKNCDHLPSFQNTKRSRYAKQLFDIKLGLLQLKRNVHFRLLKMKVKEGYLNLTKKI